MENKAVEICNLGVEEYKNGNIQKALDLFDEAEKLNPKCLEAILNKSSLFLKEKNYDRALEEAEKSKIDRITALTLQVGEMTDVLPFRAMLNGWY